MVKSITDASFQVDVLDSDKPVVVDFWAEWCGPCKSLAPIFEEVSKKFSDQVVFAKLNIDDSPEAPTRVGIRSIPTLMLFKGGQVVATRLGAASRVELENWLQEQL